MIRTFEGRFMPADKKASDYQLLPFDVPEGTRRIEVHYSYDRDPGNVLDLGVFDAGGADFATDGFRGWSGGARESFVITPRSATPGYLPGPLVPGRWHVILGLYKIAPAGCAYRVEITLSDEDGELPYPQPASRVQRDQSCQGPAWFKGDLQSHTRHSDAVGTVNDLATAARRRGLDFVAVTDHNTVSQHAHLPAHAGDDLLLISAEEVTTYYGHANVWGLNGWLEFRCRTDADVRRVIDEAHRRGLLFSVNHPKRGGPPWEFDPALPVDCVEVWNGLWPAYCEESLAFWEQELRRGRRLVAVGGSDTHQGPVDRESGFLLLGRPTTYVYADALTTEAILAGIRAGHVFISADVDMPRLLLTADADGDVHMMGDRLDVDEPVTIRCHAEGGAGHTLRLISAQGEICRQTIDSGDYTVEQRVNLRKHRYVRAELRSALVFSGETPADRPMLALTNPIYGPAM